MDSIPHPEQVAPTPTPATDETQDVFVLVRCRVAAGVKPYRVVNDIVAGAKKEVDARNGEAAYGVAPVVTAYPLAQSELPLQMLAQLRRERLEQRKAQKEDR